MPVESARARTLTHADPAEVPLQVALDALADPVRRSILRDLRSAGLIEQRDEGARRLNRLRRPEFDSAFPGLLAATIDRAD